MVGLQLIHISKWATGIKLVADYKVQHLQRQLILKAFSKMTSVYFD